jgi:hypothetical protein
MRAAAFLIALCACGDEPAHSGTLAVVGHSSLGERGMNSALAIAGDTAYVGSRNDKHGIAIVDISDPHQPNVVGEVGPAVTGLSSRELRAIPDLNLLVVLNLQCSPDLHGCSGGGIPDIELFDISDRRAPQLLSTFQTPLVFGGRASAHEMFIWRDPARPERVLVYATVASTLHILDATQRVLTPVMMWNPVRDGHIEGTGANNDLHSIGVSDDGRVAYISHQTGGLVIVDTSDLADGVATPEIRMITAPADVFRWPGTVMGPHSAVPVLGRPYLVLTEEIYPPPFGAGCPWGQLRTVDIRDPAKPVLVGEFGLPENDPAMCASIPTATAYTAHNATVTQDLALVSWYAGGLQAIDISDPAQPRQLSEIRPTQDFAVEYEDVVLADKQVEMWSYPVVKDGLIYVVDVRNGLYVVEYTGTFAAQIRDAEFLEGNSNIR